MTGRRWLAGAAAVAALGVGGWIALDRIAPGVGAAAPVAVAPVPKAEPAPDAAPETADVTELTPELAKGETPMAERVAIIGLLNKRNGEARELTMKPGQAYRVGDTIVRLRACEQTAPWEQEQLTGAFLQLDVRGTDQRWRRAFSGWVFREQPALNVVQNAVYDVWPKSCTMRFPGAGPDTVTPSSGTAPSRTSSARKSPSTEGEPESSPPTPAPSASPSATE